MDPITRAVRDMYEQYPYPTGGPTLRTSSEVRLLLSYTALPRPAGRPLTALDAGCGRGVGLLGHAQTQPDVQFLGIDINRVALADAAAEAARRGLKNVRVQEVDLMTLEGLEVPEGGFDVIYSSGVVHHLVAPTEGLRRLTEVLAPHGVIVLMLYGRPGREPLYRMARAIDLLIPRDRPISERLAVGRSLARAVQADTLTAGPWGDAARISDVEFVDRYLHVNEVSYDIAALWALLEAAGLRFLRWCEPRDWSIETQLPEGELRERAAQLPSLEQFRLIEQLCWRNGLELLVHRPENGPRPPLLREELPTAALAINPEVTFQIRRRTLRGTTRIEELSYQLRSGEPVKLTAGPLAEAVLALWDQNLPFRGAALVKLLQDGGLPAARALDVLEHLLAEEVLYRPHEVDL